MKNVQSEVNAVFASPVESAGAFIIRLYSPQTQDIPLLELQRDLEEDHLDAELGLDTYCLILPDGTSCYGGVRACVLKERQLTLSFTLQATRCLGVRAYQLQLELPKQQHLKLREGLRTLFTERHPRKFILEGQ